MGLRKFTLLRARRSHSLWRKTISSWQDSLLLAWAAGGIVVISCQSGLGISGAKSDFSQVSENPRVAQVLRDKIDPDGLGTTFEDNSMYIEYDNPGHWHIRPEDGAGLVFQRDTHSMGLIITDDEGLSILGTVESGTMETDKAGMGGPATATARA